MSSVMSTDGVCATTKVASMSGLHSLLVLRTRASTRVVWLIVTAPV